MKTVNAPPSNAIIIAGKVSNVSQGMSDLFCDLSRPVVMVKVTDGGNIEFDLLDEEDETQLYIMLNDLRRANSPLFEKLQAAYIILGKRQVLRTLGVLL